MDSTPCLLLVPGPGLGHINGLTLLAKSLLSTGLSLSYVCFARSYHAHASHNRLRSLDAAIHFEVLDDGLSSSESYADLFDVSATMRDSLVRLVERLRTQHRPACCIVSDPLMAWTQDVADQFGIPRVDYWTATASSYLLTLAIPELISRGYLPLNAATNDWNTENPTRIDFIPGLPKLALESFPKEIFADVSNPLVQRLLTAAARARNAERVLIHSLRELEGGAFEGLREWGIEAYAVGPLIQYAFEQSGEKRECEMWLDTQADSSVIYVSFGSNALMAREEILELAFGLEASGQPVLWVVRSDTMIEGELSENALPEGFESRTKGRIRIESWAPQVAVLGHRAVGGFLTHCGWNSTLESIWMGVPMLGCPRGAEQRGNAKYIAEDWGVGMELGRTKEGGVERGEVERAVKSLMIGKEGEVARSRARELREAARKTSSPGGHSHANLLKFAHDMRCQQQSILLDM